MNGYTLEMGRKGREDSSENDEWQRKSDAREDKMRPREWTGVKSWMNGEGEEPQSKEGRRKEGCARASERDVSVRRGQMERMKRKWRDAQTKASARAVESAFMKRKTDITSERAHVLRRLHECVLEARDQGEDLGERDLRAAHQQVERRGDLHAVLVETLRRMFAAWVGWSRKVRVRKGGMESASDGMEWMGRAGEIDKCGWVRCGENKIKMGRPANGEDVDEGVTGGREGSE
ncbi:hypothetical protein DFH09DRAFT_1088675 [Mycena vulgaris]|nr:hypothetical protein DFH09DRAFT_1088675 [Mycena vulgaris]